MDQIDKLMMEVEVKIDKYKSMCSKFLNVMNRIEEIEQQNGVPSEGLDMVRKFIDIVGNMRSLLINLENLMEDHEMKEEDIEKMNSIIASTVEGRLEQVEPLLKTFVADYNLNYDDFE